MIEVRARSFRSSTDQSSTATPTIGQSRSPRRSSRYRDRNVITFARSPLIPKITRTSVGRASGVRAPPMGTLRSIEARTGIGPVGLMLSRNAPGCLPGEPASIVNTSTGRGGPMADRPKVLVLGGGFGGVGAVKKLKHADADVVLVDRHDYHTFQPLLYQVATDLIETTTVGHQLRDLVRRDANGAVHEDKVSGLHLAKRSVTFGEMAPQGYHYLILGLGATVNYFGVPGADEHAYPMYTLPDAVRLRRRILERWESTDRDPSLADDGALNVVV